MKQYTIMLPEELAAYYEGLARKEGRDIQQLLVKWLKTIAEILRR